MNFRKTIIYLCSAFLGLFCLCAGMFLFTSDALGPPAEDSVRAQYTAEFYRETNNISSTAIKIVNCTTGTTYTATTGTWVNVSYSTTDTLCVYINSSSYNYEIGWLDNRNDELTFINEYYILGSDLYEILKYGNGIFLNIISSYSEKFITFNANGGSFATGTYNSSNNRVYTSGTLLFTFGGRNFYKKYNGTAYVSYAHRAMRWTGPFLIGTTANSVAYYTSVNTSTVFTYSQTFSYNGTTYYLSAFDYSMPDCFDTSARTYPYINTRDLVTSTHYGSGFNINLVIAQLTLERASTYAGIWTESGTYTLPYNNPTRTGYTFDGWYTTSASTGGTKITTSTTNPSYNRTVYARWTENTYDLCFEHPDSDRNPPSGTTTYEYVSYNDTFTFDTGSCNPGYHFTYWDCPDAGMVWEPGESVSISTLVSLTGLSTNGSTIPFYGCSEENYNTFTFDLNGGTEIGAFVADDYYVCWDDYIYMPDTYEVERTGYTLTGWYTVAEYGSYTFNPGARVYVADFLNDDMYNMTFTLVAQWEINTYTLTVGNGYYYSASGYSVSLTAPGCTITNATLSSSSPTSIISHTYSTTPITVTITRSDSCLWIYVDGAIQAGGDSPQSYSWTPNANRTLTWYIREYWTISSSGEEGISSYGISGTQAGTGRAISGTSSSKVEQGTEVTFSASVKTGYVFDGWYNGTTKISSDTTYKTIPVVLNLSLTAKATKIYDKVIYDSSRQYFYFEDGYYPQTYAGDSMNSTLNSWHASQTAVAEYYINNKKSYAYNYGGTWYARIYCPKTTTVTLKSGSNKTFSSGSYYWFVCDPIRWRVSEYGVSQDYYSSTLYSKFVNAGCVNGVSEYVLDYDAVVQSGTKVVEGWKYSSSNLYLNIAHSNSYAGCLNGISTSKQFDYFNNNGTNKKVSQESLSTSSFVQISLADISLAGITDYRAKGSDLACMLMGMNASSYCNYSTRDLYDLSSGKYITIDGAVRNWWLNVACGVRLAYAGTGKSS